MTKRSSCSRFSRLVWKKVAPVGNSEGCAGKKRTRVWKTVGRIRKKLALHVFQLHLREKKKPLWSFQTTVHENKTSLHRFEGLCKRGS